MRIFLRPYTCEKFISLYYEVLAGGAKGDFESVVLLT
jgi:hypothetical protein